MKRVKTQIELNFVNQYPDFNEKVDEKEIEEISVKLCNYFISDKDIVAKSTLAGIKYDKISFEMIFVNNDSIFEINSEYRKKNSPTDVITFALFADAEPKFVFDGEVNLGEIIISLDRIQEQAGEVGNTFKDELYYIISHGILHLLGFDHLSEEEYDFMIGLQKKSLKEVYDKIYE